MNRLLLAGVAAGWVLLLLVQSLAGPFDGYVPAHVTDDGARDLWSFVAGPIAGGRWHTPELAHAAAVPFTILLVVVPVLSVVAVGTMLGPRGRTSGGVTLLASVLVLAALALASLTSLSNDLYLYRAQGLMMVRAHLNPYAHAPTECVAVEDLGNVPWEDKRSAYGPLALRMFRAGALRPGVAPGFWTLRLLMGLPLLALVAFVALRRAIAPGRRALLVAWLGLNPLLLLEVHENAHLEGWIGLFLLGALVAIRRPGWRAAVLAGVLTGLATALKPSGVVTLGATTAWLAAGATGGRLTRRGAALAAAHVAAAAVVTAALYAPFWIGPGTFEGVGAVATKTLRSIHFVLLWIGLNPSAVNEFGALGTLASIGVGAWLAWRKGRPAEGMMAAIGLHAVLGRTFFQPWYVAPMLFLALPGLAGGGLSRRTTGVLLAWSASAVAGGYAPFYLRATLAPAWQTFSLALILVPPIVALLASPSQVQLWMSFLYRMRWGRSASAPIRR